MSHAQPRARPMNPAASSPSHPASRQGQFDDEARAAAPPLGVVLVLGPDAPAMAHQDLTRDGQAQARILAEAVFGRPLGIEALKYPLQIVVRDSRSVIFHRGTHMSAGDMDGHANNAVVGAER